MIDTYRPVWTRNLTTVLPARAPIAHGVYRTFMTIWQRIDRVLGVAAAASGLEGSCWVP